MILRKGTGKRDAPAVPGRCFPAGHATNGFAFIGGWFALRATYPKAARVVLVASLCVGGGMGVLGPTRMDYPGTIATVRAVARYVGDLLAQG